MSVAITCATCGLFFDDFGAFEAHQIDTCRPTSDAINLWQQIHQVRHCEDADTWRSTVTVRDALFLRQIRIDPL